VPLCECVGVLILYICICIYFVGNEKKICKIVIQSHVPVCSCEQYMFVWTRSILSFLYLRGHL